VFGLLQVGLIALALSDELKKADLQRLQNLLGRFHTSKPLKEELKLIDQNWRLFWRNCI